MRRLLTILPALALGAACGDSAPSGTAEDDVMSGFDSSGSEDNGTTDGTETTPSTTTDDTTTSDDEPTSAGPGNPGTDGGEPGDPEPGDELCDAGDEAWAKRTIQFIHGRKPASIREVQLLVSMVEQIDRLGDDGRYVVARGLSRGDEYIERWKTYLYESIKVNRTGDRRNEECYDLLYGAESDSPDLAAFIRDNTAEAQYSGPDFWMRDVVYSSLHLDDVSPLYRADLFARVSAPIVAANVSQDELEEMRRSNFGQNFENVFLGRNTECNACHMAHDAVTYDPNELLNRHWPVPGNLELAVYGEDDAKLADHDTSYAVFRMRNFGYPQDDSPIAGDNYPPGSIQAWDMGPVCGAFLMTNPGADTLSHDPYLISDYSGAGQNGTIYDLDVHLQAGFDALRDNGIVVGGDESVDPEMAAAYLISLNISETMWTEALGYPLTVANNFPRNADQSEILETLTASFVADSFSLRTLISEVATHELYNQAAPIDCGSTTPYHLPAVFDPFSKSNIDPSAQGNGVGDGVHRLGAWVLADSVSQAMWWNKADRFGPDDGQIPGFNCGGAMPQIPCVGEPDSAFLMRDIGTFLSDSEGGFEGTDFVALLRLEHTYGTAGDPGLIGPCTGALGSSCATGDWIEQLIDEAGNGTDMWDVASAVKDRLITEPTIYGEAEVAVLEDLMGVELSDSVSDVGASNAEDAARRLAGMLIGTPQFLLVGVPPTDQDPVENPTLVVPGTDTEDLCEYLAPLILDNDVDGFTYGYNCTADDIVISN